MKQTVALLDVLLAFEKRECSLQKPGSQTWYKAVGNILTPVSTWHTPNAPVVSRKDIMFLIKE
jgi:hypothetical protein